MTHHIPQDHHAVTPYLHIEEADAFAAFLTEAFGATVLKMHHEPDGRLMHGEVRLEGSILELSEARTNCAATRSALHVFVPDVDASYQRAIAAGATSAYAPTDHDYGERSGGVRDRWGNSWYLATVIDAEARGR